MTSENSQNKSQPVQQNIDPDGALPSQSDGDLEKLARFFQLLDEWDRRTGKQSRL